MKRLLSLTLPLALGVLGTLSSCVSLYSYEPLATHTVAADFESYTIRRVGLVPFAGKEMTGEDARAFQDMFFTELSRRARFEIVPLTLSDLEEIPGSEPFRIGWIRPRTVIELSRRFNLDGILIGSITEREPFAPQRFGAQMELIAAETGVPIWSSTVHVDASDERVRAGIQHWFESTRSMEKSGETWQLALLSPRRFAQFAAYEVSRSIDRR